MFSIKTVGLPSGDVYEVTCFNEALANEVYEVAYEADATPHVEDDGDPCKVVILYAGSEKQIDAIVIEARNRFDRAMLAA